ncbi:MAG: hypothetical protein IPM54_28205 [Polyangiaceae bacterium]|nr:hypothetical protein [Polyangiaceae bacterium]
MKTYQSCTIGLLGLLGASGCDVVLGMDPGQLDPIRTVSGVLSKDATWKADQVTTLEGIVYVDSGATLTIEEGTRIVAKKGAALYVRRGGKLVARGTKEKPIVFTSAASSRAPGDWHGVYLCGRAPINGVPSTGYTPDTIPSYQGEGQVPEEDRCGGDISEDSSGEVRFVRIEFTGAENPWGGASAGLELAGVGSGTVVDHVQVHATVDDAVVMFGGTVQLKYVLVTRGLEDAFDWAYGWRGKAQFVAAWSSDDGFEGGADEMDALDKSPNDDMPSNAMIYNATLVGDPNTGSIGLNLESGIQGKFYNVLVANFFDYGVSIELDATKDNAVAGTLDVRNSIFSNPVNFDPRTLSGAWQAQTWLMTEDPTRMNRALPEGKHGIRSLTPGALDFSLVDGAPGLSGAAAPPDDGFFEPVNFVGACGATCPEFEGWTDEPVD